MPDQYDPNQLAAVPPDPIPETPDEVVVGGVVQPRNPGKIDIPYEQACMRSATDEGNSMRALLDQGGGAAKLLAAASGHDAMLGVRIISEEEAGLIMTENPVKSAVDAATELTGQPQTPQAAAGNLGTLLFSRGQVCLDQQTGRKVTVVKLEVGKTKKGRAIHRVIDIKSGDKYDVSERHLQQLR